MFNPFKPKTDSDLQDLIDHAQSQLDSYDADSEEYDKILSQLERLDKLLTRKREGKRISPDTLAIVIGNLVGILLILNFERIGIVTSKAVGFVIKSKL